MFAFELGANSLLGPLLGGALCMLALRLSAPLCASVTRSRDLRTIARVKRAAAPDRPASREEQHDARSA